MHITGPNINTQLYIRATTTYAGKNSCGASVTGSSNNLYCFASRIEVSQGFCFPESKSTHVEILIIEINDFEIWLLPDSEARKSRFQWRSIQLNEVSHGIIIFANRLLLFWSSVKSVKGIYAFRFSRGV